MKNYYYYLILLFVSCFTFQVSAQNSPEMTCPMDDTFTTDMGMCIGTATFITPAATDPDNPSAVLVVNQIGGLASGSLFPLGDTIITFEAIDSNGNDSTTCSFTITVVDNQDPIADIETLTDVTAECEVDTSGLTPPTATDNCSTSINGTTPGVTINTQGTTPITWTYDDGNGNTSSQIQNVVINDMTPPVADMETLEDITAQCEVDTSGLTPPKATDACEGEIIGTTPTRTITAQGTTEITWTYDDGNGYTSMQTQDIVIDDMTPPTIDINLPFTINSECEVTASDLTEPVPTDNCGGTIVITNDAPATISVTTLVTWTYDDGNGNTSMQQQNVVIDDKSAPVADIVTLEDITAQCEVDTSLLTPPKANDFCEGEIIGTTPPTTITAQGTTTITWTYDDGNGNTSTQTQDVVIDDMTPPALDSALPFAITAECEVTSLTDPSPIDNCGGAVTITHDATTPINTQGTTVVTWTYVDDNGNTSMQTQNIVINDETAPEADAMTLTDSTAECEVDTSLLTPPTATDTCVGDITATTPPITITTQGTTVITWTYDDGNGNTSTQTQDVVIDDVTAPVADAMTLTNITAECEVDTSMLIPPTATDTCVGDITATTPPIIITTQGMTTITWTYDDGNGNTSTQTQDVVINDETDPVPDVAILADFTADCEVTASDLTPPTATDNCGGMVTVTSDANGLPLTGEGMTTMITWTYNDGNGNTSMQTQNVVIKDVTPPTIDVNLPFTINAECEVAASDLIEPIPSDNCGENVTITHDAPTIISETTLVTWTYEDNQGNKSMQTQNVVIKDVTAPEPDKPLLDDITDECEVTTLTPPTANDNCSTSLVTVSHNIATLPIITQGTTVITWTYDDGKGNTSTQTQNVVINDETPPTLDGTLPFTINAECAVTSLSEPTSTDNCGGEVTITHDAELPITTQGTTLITWTYTDENGNESMQQQNIEIKDETAPEPGIDMLANIMADCEVTSLTPPTAIDNCGADVTITHDATLPISGESTTEVTWTYEDVNGNKSTQKQNIVIKDMSAPVADAETLTDIIAECYVDTSMLAIPTATDACEGVINGTITNETITSQGTTKITWTYDDGKGNTSMQTQNVVITDVTFPTLNCAENVVVNTDPGECEVVVVFGNAVATDNCGVGTTIVTQTAGLQSGDSFPKGVNIIEFTATDVGGNKTTCSITVTVVDNEAPVADQTSLTDINANCEVTSLTAPFATDNCSADVTVTNNATFPIQATSIVIWTYADEDGNSTNQNQNVIINDPTLPVITDCPADSVVTPDDNGDYSVLDYSSLISATDNCTAAEDLVVTQSPAIGYVLKEGAVQTVNLSVADLAGNNSTTCSFDITVDATLGNADAEFTASRVVLYPNPSSDTVFIKTTNIPLIDAQIYDLSGRLIKTINFEQTQDYKIDVSNLETAQYFLNLNSERGSVFKRFVKN